MGGIRGEWMRVRKGDVSERDELEVSCMVSFSMLWCES
jgi:hypothetical protein